jgi:organic radical activating enzyme
MMLKLWRTVFVRLQTCQYKSKLCDAWAYRYEWLCQRLHPGSKRP